MKTIGLLGGMSWESTVTYYQILNRTVKEHLGGLHSAKLVLYSVDFHEIEQHQSRGEWEKGAAILADAAQSLEKAGADFIVLCTNTMHKVAPQLESAVSIPLLHIADATAQELLANSIRKVGLLGTKYTMTQDFYKDKLLGAGIDVIIPERGDMERINAVIFDELCRGIVSERSKQATLGIIESLAQKGAQAVILGCTEIGLLISAEDTTVPVFDTTQIHARKAALLAMGR